MDKNKGIGCLDLIMLGVFFLGLALTFSKTADLMGGFAPRTFLGYTGIESAYGILAALLVDGTIGLMKAKMMLDGRAKSQVEWFWDIILTLFPFGISAFAQVFDSFMVRQTLDAQPAGVQFLATWGIPLIPVMIIGGFLVYGFIVSAPEGMFQGAVSPGGTGGGLRLKIPPLPDLRKILARPGKNGRSPDPTPASIEKKEPQPESSKPTR